MPLWVVKAGKCGSVGVVKDGITPALKSAKEKNGKVGIC